MSEKKDYIDKLTEQLRELDNRLNDLKEKGEKASEEFKMKYKKEIEELNERKEKLQTQFKSLAHSSSEAWKDVKIELDEAIKKIKDAINKHF